MTDLTQFTINARKSHRQPQCISQILCEDRVFFVSVDFYVSLCGQQHPKCEPPILLMYPLFFCKLRSSSIPRAKQLHFGKHSELDYVHTIFVTMTDTITPPNTELSSWITLYVTETLQTF
jgi:hypothetical protein